VIIFYQKEAHHNHKCINFHIVSGAEEELRWLCSQIGISEYFKTIEESTTPEPELVSKIIKNMNYRPEECVLVVDAINDYDAARENGIAFFGYNNPSLKQFKTGYIDSFNVERIPFLINTDFLNQ